MKTAAIIAEYNPFHNGHKLHIEKTREAGATHIMAVMSGNFVQRGDAAIFDKYVRARTALENGVDLVIELPARFSLMSAEGFARGAVSLITAMKCVDMLSFGSESGDTAALKEASAAIDYCIHTEEFNHEITRGRSYPAALQAALRVYYTPDVSELIACPNNTLAIEYISALDNAGSRMELFTVPREVAHDSDEETENLASASEIRSKIRKGADYSAFAPLADAETADIKRLERAILAKLRAMSAEDYDKLYDARGGLGRRLYKASREAGTLEELYFLAKNKSVTLARIRRAALCGFLGVTKTMSAARPAYIHILGMNEKGREILKKAAENGCELPTDTSLKALSGQSASAGKQAALEARLDDIYGLTFEKARPCGASFTAKPVVIEKDG